MAGDWLIDEIVGWKAKGINLWLACWNNTQSRRPRITGDRYAPGCYGAPHMPCGCWASCRWLVVAEVDTSPTSALGMPVLARLPSRPRQHWCEACDPFYRRRSPIPRCRAVRARTASQVCALRLCTWSREQKPPRPTIRQRSTPSWSTRAPSTLHTQWCKDSYLPSWWRGL